MALYQINSSTGADGWYYEEMVLIIAFTEREREREAYLGRTCRDQTPVPRPSEQARIRR